MKACSVMALTSVAKASCYAQCPSHRKKTSGGIADAYEHKSPLQAQTNTTVDSSLSVGAPPFGGVAAARSLLQASGVTVVTHPAGRALHALLEIRAQCLGVAD